MSDNSLPQAPFLPAQAPRAMIIDPGNALSAQAKGELERQAQTLGYKVKVVVLPSDFSPASPDSFALDLARQWQLSGRKLLILVDLKAHKVRGISGPELNAAGISGTYLRKELFPTSFIPYMKEGDLQGAIAHTLAAVNNSLEARMATGSAGVAGQYTRHGGVYGGSTQGPGVDWLWQIGIFVAIGLAIFGIAYRSRADRNKRLLEKLSEQLNLLYQQADQIGQASEYLDRDKFAELAAQVASFFNQLTILDKARSEVDLLQKQRRVWKVGDGLLKCLRLSEFLEGQAEPLLSQINSVTGGVDRKPAALQAEKAMQEIAADAPRTISIPQAERFRRPAWTLEPVYAPGPSVMGGADGLMSLMLVLNQMEMNRRLDNLADQIHQPFNGGLSGDALPEHGGWQSPGYGDSGEASWDNNSSQDFGDSGWSDFGDVGGGGDFGGGSGDW